jgi:hypothetical protein
MGNAFSFVRVFAVLGAFLLAMPSERFARSISAGSSKDPCSTTKLKAKNCYDSTGNPCGAQWQKCQGCLGGNLTPAKEFVCLEDTGYVCQTADPDCKSRPHKLSGDCITQTCP